VQDHAFSVLSSSRARWRGERRWPSEQCDEDPRQKPWALTGNYLQVLLYLRRTVFKVVS